MAKKKLKTIREGSGYSGPLTANGEIPDHFPPNEVFGLGQGERLEPPNNQHWEFRIHLVELDNGKWIAGRTSKSSHCHSGSYQYPDRKTALRDAVAMVVTTARDKARAGKREDRPMFYRITPEAAQTVINWALGLLDKEPVKVFVKAVHTQAAAIKQTPVGQLDIFGQTPGHSVSMRL